MMLHRAAVDSARGGRGEGYSKKAPNNSVVEERRHTNDNFVSGSRLRCAAPIVEAGEARRPRQIHGLHVGELESRAFNQLGNGPVDVAAAADLLPDGRDAML